jgi:hypothetical protein
MALDKKGRLQEVDRLGALIQFARGRVSRPLSTVLQTMHSKNFKNEDIDGIEIAKDFVIPLGWRDFDDLLEREGFTRGSFIQLLNILGVTHKIAD